MKEKITVGELLLKIEDLQNRLDESEQLIDAIKAGEVDAFAINNGNDSEIYTLQSGDYAYRVLIEEFEEGAINVSEEGLIVYTNPYFSNLLKLEYEKVIGASIFDFVHKESKEKFHALFREALSGKSKGEINLAVNDIIVPAYVSLTSLQPKLATVGIIITDLSHKKKNEEVIFQYQKELEANNLELLNRNTELASFAYIASHDLQEPLRKIQTFATRILEKEYDNLSESGKDHFARMHISAKRMQTLIDDLLTYSRTKIGVDKFETVNLTEIIEEVKADLKEEMQQRNAILEVSVSCDVHVIPFQFRQLFTNLIRNSLKFSDPGRSPVIKIKTEMPSGKDFKNEKFTGGNYCHITLSDNGIGFEQQYGEKIFELFQRLHGNTQYQGTGIGLAIVKKIIDNHNGFITAKSELGKGALFDIYIPVLNR